MKWENIEIKEFFTNCKQLMDNTCAGYIRFGNFNNVKNVHHIITQLGLQIHFNSLEEKNRLTKLTPVLTINTTLIEIFERTIATYLLPLQNNILNKKSLKKSNVSRKKIAGGLYAYSQNVSTAIRVVMSLKKKHPLC